MATPFRNAFTKTSDILQATINVSFSSFDFTSYTQYREDESLNLQDLDASAGPFFDINLGIDDETISQEFLFNSKSGSDLQWTAGLNYFQNRDTYDVNASFGAAPFTPFGGSSTLTKSYAGFVDLTYEMTPQFFLTVGYPLQLRRGDGCLFLYELRTDLLHRRQWQSGIDPPAHLHPAADENSRR